MADIGDFCIFRSQIDGVKCGYLESCTMQPDGLACCVIRESRIIHYWQQNNMNYTLTELANHGVRPPALARISEATERPTTMFGVGGLYPCTKRAQENLSQSRWNKPYKPSV